MRGHIFLVGPPDDRHVRIVDEAGHELRNIRAITVRVGEEGGVWAEFEMVDEALGLGVVGKHSSYTQKASLW